MASFMLSIPKQRALVILPSVLSPFSLLGSVVVIYLIFRRKDKSSNRSYSRLMLMICVVNLICLSWWMMGSLPLPRQTGFYGARGTIRECTATYQSGSLILVFIFCSIKRVIGNTTTCAIGGFFLQLSFAQITYNVGVVLYFLLTIRFGMKQERFAKQVEPLVHIVSILFPLIAAVVALFMKSFNPVGYGNVCYLGSYPPACSVLPGVECTRGQSAHILVWFFMIGPGFMYASFYYIAIFLIYKTVQKQEMRTIRSSLNSETVKARVRAVAVQSILYAVFFFNSFFWISLVPLLTAIAKDPIKMLDHWAVYGIQIVAQIFFSLQVRFQSED